MGVGFGVQRVVVIAGGLRVQRRLNGRKARVSDGRGRQAGVKPGVIGAVLGQHLRRGSALVVGIEVENGGVNTQRHTGIQTVKDDGGYKSSFVNPLFGVNSGFLFDERSNREHLIERQAPVRRLLEHVCRKDIVKALKELVDGAGGLHTHIELVGIREEEAFQSGHIPRLDSLKEGVFIVGVCGSLHQVIIAADAVFFQLPEDLFQRIAFRYGDLNGHGRTGAGLHILDQRAVVKGGFQLIAARRHLGIRVGDLAEELKQPFILNEPRLLQLGGHKVDIRPADSLRAGLVAILVEGVHRLCFENG